MSDGVSPGIRATIREHLRNLWLNWVKNGRFYTALRDKTKNGMQKMHPRHIKEVLADIFNKAKNGIIKFVKKLLSSPMNFVRMLVAFMIGELVESKELHNKLMTHFTKKRIA
ncbi:hypothetical protein DASC09_045780 [Saccharomycopsis crataegensis]|uniref:Uncharacterized protein n=1 Tax=Saccharomycopsis crataegensis TaxID=43959 RepID=A0AAV5QR24_9ASCO|nr:hypothetical protein DASC09_045780 [Saccharomycopsis crataegensis]